jgi:hypothetical protein
MKRSLVAISALVLVGCVHTTVATNSLIGIWYSGQAINRTDYRLDDCSYKQDGTFDCTVLDRGCSSFCEGASFSYAGTWSLVGTTLTRRITSGLGPKEPQSWGIAFNNGELLLSNGQRWFRSKKARSKQLWDAL